MSTMAHNLPTSTIASNANYLSILDNALDEYRKKTGKDLRSDPLSSELELCGSPDAILSVFREHVPGFDQRQSSHDKSTGWLDATVNVLYAFSVTINSVSGGINVACPLAGAIFTGIGILLSAAQAARSNRDSLVDLFERIENFFRRLEAYTNVPPTPGMVDIIVKILVKVLSILSIATKEIKQSRAILEELPWEE
ncbi:hypothetical protein BC826DRAFT_1179478 [Russula brevipes]|nr:hypothetical protein BC826DRAFT_1179478 [Russula brevipes]